MPKFIDLTNNIFNALTVLYRGENSKTGHVRWVCRCSCGEVVLVFGGSLTFGSTGSCGCLSDRGKRYSSKNNYIYKKFNKKRKRGSLIYGVGINDGNENIASKQCENTDEYLIYHMWTGMLRRCYSLPFKNRNPTYKNCAVERNWHKFSHFKAWVETQDWKGKELDKDILIKGNKLYSSSTCLFVSHSINSLFICSYPSERCLPHGVTFDKVNKKYRAKVSFGGKTIHIGRYSFVGDAVSAYKKIKAKIIYDSALEQIDIKVYSALIMRSYEFLDR